jgi:dUTP pyrophosphatase
VISGILYVPDCRILHSLIMAEATGKNIIVGASGSLDMSLSPSPPFLPFACEIKCQLVGANAKVPVKTHFWDAGWDLAYCPDTEVKTMSICPGQTVKVNTGLAFAIPQGWVGILKERSSVGGKGIGLRAGVIDSTYRGVVKVVLTNHSDSLFQINEGDRIAQMVVIPLGRQSMTTCSVLETTNRGDGGFGSTGC